MTNGTLVSCITLIRGGETDEIRPMDGQHLLLLPAARPSHGGPIRRRYQFLISSEIVEKISKNKWRRNSSDRTPK